MAHDVFISYSTGDKPTADAVCATLEAKHIRCWIAPRDVLPGRDYAEMLIEAIRDARVMVLVFSANSNSSLHVMREVERAASKGIPILPLRIEDVPPCASMEYYISSTHWLDALTPPLERHLQQLAETVRLLLARVERAAPMGEEPEAQRKAEQEEAARLAAQAEAHQRAEEVAARLAAQAEARQRAEEAARLAAEAKAPVSAATAEAAVYAGVARAPPPPGAPEVAKRWGRRPLALFAMGAAAIAAVAIRRTRALPRVLAITAAALIFVCAIGLGVFFGTRGSEAGGTAASTDTSTSVTSTTVTSTTTTVHSTTTSPGSTGVAGWYWYSTTSTIAAATTTAPTTTSTTVKQTTTTKKATPTTKKPTPTTTKPPTTQPASPPTTFGPG